MRNIAIVVTLGIVAGIFLIEWMAGCTGHYIAADGQRHRNECVIVDAPRKGE